MKVEGLSSTPPPLSPYGTFQGELFQYAPNLVAFESNGQHPHKCILIGGLSDGLIPVPYTKQLLPAANDPSWSLVQPVTSSSYTGFGHGRLDRDVEELKALIEYLHAHRGLRHYSLVGHSTGCQCIVHFLKQSPSPTTDLCRLAVLQAPASDREHAAWADPDLYHTHLEYAQSHRDQPDELMPRAAFWCPITVQRFLDLHEKGGMDDYFSSDYTDVELSERLQHMDKVRSLVVFSGSDEFVMPSVDTVVLTQRLVNAMNSQDDMGMKLAEGLHLPNANHNLSVGEVDQFAQRVRELIKKCLN